MPPGGLIVMKASVGLSNVKLIYAQADNIVADAILWNTLRVFTAQARR